MSYLLAYSISSPFSAFIAYTVFASQSEASIDDPYARETLNWWTGFTLLIAVGTLTYITLMHILPEVFFNSGHEEHDHFGGEGDHNHSDNHDEKHAHDYHKLKGGDNEGVLPRFGPQKEAGAQKEDLDQLDVSHEHNDKEGVDERMWKLVTLLAGLYTAELLRFV